MTENGKRSTLELALDYIDSHPRRYIFPIKAGAKSPPLIADNLNKASNNPALIKTWHVLRPGCNWGVALKKSRVIVADVDCKPGKRGRETYDALDRQYGWPATEAVQTPSGGLHLYYDGEHVFGVGAFGTDIDSPNYTLVPGCTLADGTSYRAMPKCPKVVPAPAWFYEVLKRQQSAAEAAEQVPVIELDQNVSIQWAIEYLKRDAPPARQGDNGDATTLKVAATLKDRGISEEMALELMAEHYNGRCEPPWQIGEGEDKDRLDAKVRNAYTYLKNRAPGEDTAEADFATDPVPPAPEEQPTEVRRPHVVLRPSFLPQAIEQVERHLLAEAKRINNVPDRIFQRDGKLVRLSRNLLPKGETTDQHFREHNALVIVEVKPKWLANRLDRSIQFVGPSAGNPAKKSDKAKLVPKNASAELVARMIEDSTRWPFPVLHSTIEAPTLRADGTILDVPGYDEATGLYFDPGDVTFPKIDPRPSRKAGLTALRQIEDILCDFPFVDAPGYEGVAKSVALAMMLTGVVRRALPTAPAFAVDANEPESGKTELIKVVGTLMTGREIAAHPFSDSEEERRKALGTAFMEGRPVLFFDNVDCLIEGAALNMALTSAMFEDRNWAPMRASSRRPTRWWPSPPTIFGSVAI